MFLGKSALTANNFAVGYTTKEMIIHATGSDKKVGTGVFFKAIYWMTNHVVSKKIYKKIVSALKFSYIVRCLAVEFITRLLPI